MLVGRYLALLDANVLHPAFLRGAMQWFAEERLYRPAWSPDILAEWRRSVQRRHGDITDAKLDEMQAIMAEPFADAEITGYEAIADVLDLPDQADRHVLAAAIVGRCHGVITANLKHFPAEKVTPFRMEVVHPDDFIVNIIGLHPSRAVAACKRHRSAMTRSNPSPEEYFERYKAAGLIQAHGRLSVQKELL